MMGDFDKEAQKEALKEALTEWLDSKWAALGKWTARGLAAAGFAVLVYFYLTQTGWSR